MPAIRFLLHETPVASAMRFPDHIAFRCRDDELSYAGLVTRAGQLAGFLSEAGVRRGDRVGIYRRKGIESAIAIYGVLAAGAAYVPIDPASPRSRVRRILSDCDIAILISQESKRKDLKKLIESGSPLRAVVGLDRPLPGVASVDWGSLQSAPVRALTATRTIESDIAYIMYTSGSTGRPKGLIHTHHSGLSYAKMAVRTYGLTHADRFGNHSPLHFDMSTLEYFAAPLAGGTTVIVTEDRAMLPASLGELMERERLTIWYSVPFALVQLLLRGALERRDLSSLRWVLFGGEPFPGKYLYALTKTMPRARFSNVYGPAEVNQCTYYHVPADYRPEDTLPIGRVCDNAEAVIFDENDQEVNGSAVGELLIRSPTMMQGYWRRKDLNARCVHRRAAAGGRHEVFYRTGDLVSVEPSGNLHFHGRKDRQVKSRGYRIELDEIESLLMQHEAIQEAATVAVPNDEGSHDIGAWIVVHDGRDVSALEIRTFLAKRLPAYAIPSRIETTDAFPRTGSGKIDRPALLSLLDNDQECVPSE